MTKPCENCGEEYVFTRSTSKFCSTLCRVQFGRKDSFNARMAARGFTREGNRFIATAKASEWKEVVGSNGTV